MTEALDQNTLMAYLDGELDSESARTVERHLEHDQAARSYLSALQKSTAMARIAFNDIVHAPLPERLVDTVKNTPAKGHAGPPPVSAMAPLSEPAARPLPFKERPLHRASWRVGLPIAATIAGIMIGLGGGYGFIDWRAGKKQEMANALRQHEITALNTLRNTVLENRVSGQTMRWKSPDSKAMATITPVRTYQDKNGQFCREYRQRVRLQGKADETYGLACRTAAGQWQPRYLISTPKAVNF